MPPSRMVHHILREKRPWGNDRNLPKVPQLS